MSTDSISRSASYVLRMESEHRLRRDNTQSEVSTNEDSREESTRKMNKKAQDVGHDAEGTVNVDDNKMIAKLHADIDARKQSIKNKKEVLAEMNEVIGQLEKIDNSLDTMDVNDPEVLDQMRDIMAHRDSLLPHLKKSE